MNKATKIMIIIASSLIIIGAVMFISVLNAFNWDFYKLNTVSYGTNTHLVDEDFHSISISSQTADVVFVVSEDDECKVVCYEPENLNHKIYVENNELNIKVKDNRKWYEQFGIDFKQPKITVYLPDYYFDKFTVKVTTGDICIKDNFKVNAINLSSTTGNVTNSCSASDIRIKTVTGDIKLEDISAMSIDLNVTTGSIICNNVNCDGDIITDTNTGSIYINDSQCKNLISESGTGDINLYGVISSINIRLETNTGDIIIDSCDSPDLYLKANTGDIKGSLLSNKMFDASANTGNVNIPASADGGTCKIVTNSGDIDIEIK